MRRSSVRRAAYRVATFNTQPTQSNYSPCASFSLSPGEGWGEGLLG